jgi:hypothetical protein
MLAWHARVVGAPGREGVVEHPPRRLASRDGSPSLAFQGAADGAEDRLEESCDVARRREEEAGRLARRAGLFRLHGLRTCLQVGGGIRVDRKTSRLHEGARVALAQDERALDFVLEPAHGDGRGEGDPGAAPREHVVGQDEGYKRLRLDPREPPVSPGLAKLRTHRSRPRQAEQRAGATRRHPEPLARVGVEAREAARAVEVLGRDAREQLRRLGVDALLERHGATQPLVDLERISVREAVGQRREDRRQLVARRHGP